MNKKLNKHEKIYIIFTVSFVFILLQSAVIQSQPVLTAKGNIPNAPMGSTVDFKVENSQPGNIFIILLSSTGVCGLPITVCYDWLTDFSLSAASAIGLTNVGIIDSQGEGTGIWNVPFYQEALNLPVWAAVVTIDNNGVLEGSLQAIQVGPLQNVDNTRPDITFISPIESETYFNTVELSVTANEPISEWYYALDRDPFVSFDGSPIDLNGLQRGPVLIRVKAIDYSGNEKIEEVTFTFKTSVECNSQTTCNQHLTDPNIDKVILTQDITGCSGPCIIFDSDSKIFDGNNHKIEGNAESGNLRVPGTSMMSYFTGLLKMGGTAMGESYDSAIDLNDHSNLMVENTEITKFSVGIVGINSNNVVIQNNNIHDNTDTGIFWAFGNYFEVIGNDIEFNVDGIGAISTSNNKLFSNRINGNSLNGLNFDTLSDTEIKENFIGGSANYGVQLFSSNNNQIYHNNIQMNILQAFDDGTNSWDMGPTVGGNYWEHPTQPCLNPVNGFCSNQILIDGGSNFDNYPFENQNGWTS